MIIARFLSVLSVPQTPPALAHAQLTALKQQVPLLYAIIVINSGMLGFAHYGVAPDWLIFGPLFVLSVVCLGRTWVWTRLDLSALPPDRFVPLLRRTNRLTALISPAILAWSLSLGEYGDQTTNLYVFFYLALTAIACIFCLMHLRSAALIIVVIVTAPSVASILLRHEAILKAYAVSQTLVGSVMVFILFVYYRDFTKLVRQNQDLETLSGENLRLASVDALTALPNRRSFFPSLEATFLRAETQKEAFTLGIVDLDGFKGVNDTYGHVAGDRVLAEVAERLHAAVPPGTVLARIGGDEFALILCGGETGPDLDRVSRAIFASINEPFALGSTITRIGASIGFARYADDQSSPTQLVERADFALYEAKAHRRGAWVLFGPEHEARTRQQGAIEHALRNADFAAELDLAFQPIVDSARGRTVAFEALARWHHPQLGQVRPDHFIAVAERTGLINELTRVLLGKALSTMASWPAEVGLSFNLSMADITSPEAIDRLCALVSASGVDPARLQFEATETAMLGDFAQAKRGLERLRAMGASVALDDFGTGHSSLSYVHRLPIDKLKIDQSFTREILLLPNVRDIVGAIVDLGRRLKLDCVIEGVETAEQAALLQALGCHLMQGYLYHKPMSADVIVSYLDRESDHQKSMIEPRKAQAA